ncbi:MAG: hypothetical protein HKM04_09845 [Legionellales bacterium]|nr:hypothetical protein [Legionellales bacterium]
MPNSTFSSFYHLLIHILDKEFSISLKESITENLDLLLSLNDEDRKRFFILLNNKENIKTIRNSDNKWLRVQEDRQFLQQSGYVKYADFFFNEFVKKFNYSDILHTASSFTDLVTEMTLTITIISPTIEEISAKQPSEDEIEQEEISIVENGIDINVAPKFGSFTYYLARAVQDVFSFNEIPTIESLKNYFYQYIHSTPSSVDSFEQERIRLIHTFCESYKIWHYSDLTNNDAKFISNIEPKLVSSPGDNTFLKLMECENFQIFLNAYLPLSKSDKEHARVYKHVNETYCPSEQIETGQLPTFPPLKRSTRLDEGYIITQTEGFLFVSREPIYIAKKYSVYELLNELLSGYDQKASLSLLQNIQNLDKNNKKQFLKMLRHKWTTEFQYNEHSFLKQRDENFLQQVNMPDYFTFLNTCFPEATDLDKYLFTAISKATAAISIPHPFIEQPECAFAKPAKKEPGFFSSLTQTVGNWVNDKRSNQERYERFAQDKPIIKKAVRGFIFSRIIRVTPKEKISLTSTGAHLAIDGLKTVAGAIFAPIKGVLFIGDGIKSAFNYWEKTQFAQQYEIFYEEFGDQACNQAVDNVLNRVELIIKPVLEQLNNADYNALIRYVINKMTLAFDAINSSLLDKKNELSQVWPEYQLETKIEYMEKILFSSLFEPIRGIHHQEDIKISSTSYDLETFMARAPLKFHDQVTLYPRERDGTMKAATKNYLYKGPHFDGDIYQAAREGKDVPAVNASNLIV